MNICERADERFGVGDAKGIFKNYMHKSNFSIINKFQ